MTGNGKHTKHTTYKNGADWGMVYDVYGIVSPTLINWKEKQDTAVKIH